MLKTQKQIGTVALLGLATSLGSAQSMKELEAQFSSRLVGHSIVMRTPQVGKRLHFGADGRLLSTPKGGFRGLNDGLLVTRVRLSDTMLTIVGNPLQDRYDPQHHTIAKLRVPRDVEVEIDLPRDAGEAGIREAYWSVFFKVQELAERRCTDYQYVEWLIPAKTAAGTKNKDHSNDQQDSVCFPSGVRAYRASRRGVEPGRAIKVVDPSYPYDELVALSEKTLDIAIRIDETGKITDAILINPATVGFDDVAEEALRKWEFTPCKLNGAAVPCVATAVMSFRLR